MWDTRNPDYPFSPKWDGCAHQWREHGDGGNAHYEEVVCERCGCPGERDRIVGGVYWPAT